MAPRTASRNLEGTVPEASYYIPKSPELASVEISRLMEVSEASLLVLYQEIERASTREALRNAFRQLNSFSSKLFEADALGVHNYLVRDTLIFFRVSERLETSLGSIKQVNIAIVQYKKTEKEFCNFYS